MILEALFTATLVALTALAGVFFFGRGQHVVSIQRFIVPIAVGVFLSLVLCELIPQTLALSPEYGGIAVAIGFIGFYILASVLHKRYHHLEDDKYEPRGAAMLLLIGDAVHNTADGVILGGAFLVDTRVGVATAIGLALHEIPQEIVEFGVLLRAGLTRRNAALLNLLSASGIIWGTLFTLLIAAHSEQYIWLLTGSVAGNLLYLASSDLLPRIRGNLEFYGGIWKTAFSLTLGFLIMTSILVWTDGHSEHGHNHDAHQAPPKTVA